MDTWILLRVMEANGERNRIVYVLKSRGMAHSNQLREVMLTNNGIRLREVYAGPQGVITGTARTSREAEEKAAATLRQQAIARKRRDIDHKRQALDARIAALRAEFAIEHEVATEEIRISEQREDTLAAERAEMGRARGSTPDAVRQRNRRNPLRNNGRGGRR